MKRRRRRSTWRANTWFGWTDDADVAATTTEPDKQPTSDREKKLQDEIDRLEARLAAMEIKGAAQPPAETKADGTSTSTTASLNPADVSSLGAAPDSQAGTTTASASATTAAPASGAPAPAAAADPAPALPQGLQPPPAAQGPDLQTPFAYGDFSWMNGTGRGTPAFDTSFFTPEIRFDTNYIDSSNHPVDHTLGGSTESYRSGEVQIEQASFGGDFHWNNVRGRILTMFGEFATTTPRNDASAGVGQWDLNDAYRYVSEAWGG